MIQQPLPLFQPTSGAVISECQRYRYHLWRDLGAGHGSVCFVMLNPSTADAEADDPTVRRCIAFARRWGRRQLDVVNLFAFRATDPANLHGATDPVGPENDAWIQRITGRADMLVGAWGRHGAYRERAAQVALMLPGMACLGVNQDGSPKHPLYLPADAALVPYGRVS